jgi:hypothetical protein
MAGYSLSCWTAEDLAVSGAVALQQGKVTFGAWGRIPTDAFTLEIEVRPFPCQALNVMH